MPSINDSDKFEIPSNEPVLSSQLMKNIWISPLPSSLDHSIHHVRAHQSDGDPSRFDSIDLRLHESWQWRALVKERTRWFRRLVRGFVCFMLDTSLRQRQRQRQLKHKHIYLLKIRRRSHGKFLKKELSLQRQWSVSLCGACHLSLERNWTVSLHLKSLFENSRLKWTASLLWAMFKPRFDL